MLLSFLHANFAPRKKREKEGERKKERKNPVYRPYRRIALSLNHFARKGERSGLYARGYVVESDTTVIVVIDGDRNGNETRIIGRRPIFGRAPNINFPPDCVVISPRHTNWRNPRGRTARGNFFSPRRYIKVSRRNLTKQVNFNLVTTKTRATAEIKFATGAFSARAKRTGITGR